MIDSDPPKLIFTAMWMVASNPSILSLHVKHWGQNILKTQVDEFMLCFLLTTEPVQILSCSKEGHHTLLLLGTGLLFS